MHEPEDDAGAPDRVGVEDDFDDDATDGGRERSGRGTQDGGPAVLDVVAEDGVETGGRGGAGDSDSGDDSDDVAGDDAGDVAGDDAGDVAGDDADDDAGNGDHGAGNTDRAEVGDRDGAAGGSGNGGLAHRELTIRTTAVPSFERGYDWTIAALVPADGDAAAHDRIESAAGNVAVDYRVRVDPGEPKDTDFRVGGTIAVGNPNSAAVAGVTLTSALPGVRCAVETADGDAVDGAVTIPRGGATFTYGCRMPAGTTADDGGTHTATVAWVRATSPRRAATASAAAAFAFAAATPDASHASATIVAERADLARRPAGNLVRAEDGPRVFDYSLVWPGIRGRCVDYGTTAVLTTSDGAASEASRTVTLCRGAALRVESNVVSSFDRSYLWDVDLTHTGSGTYEADPETGDVTVQYEVRARPRGTTGDEAADDAGWAMLGTITVANPNDWQGIEATVGDAADLGGGGACVVVGGTTGPGRSWRGDADPAAPGFQALIPARTAVDFDYVCPFDARPHSAGRNTATVTWDAAATHTREGSASLGVPVDLGALAEAGEPAGTAAPGASGEPPANRTVEVGDDAYDAESAWSATLASGAAAHTRTYSVTWTVAEPGTCQTFTSTATARGDAAGALAAASATIEACRRAPLEVVKDVRATLERTYLWSIEKTARPAHREIHHARAARFGYTVTATPNGHRDTGWTLDGTITLTNPNTFADGAVTATVGGAAAVGGGAECAIDGTDADPETAGFQAFVPAPTGGSTGVVVLGYRCAFAGTPAPTGTDTTTVDWGGGVADATVPVVFTPRTATDRRVVVYDDRGDPGRAPAPLGTADWNRAKTPTVFDAELTHEGAAGVCTDFTSTAWIDAAGTDPTARERATLCVEDDLRLTQTASAGFDRTYGWDLRASADATEVAAGPDGRHTVGYTVRAVPDGSRDSGWELGGTVSITNPNSYAGGSITATVRVLTGVGGGASCAVDGGPTATLAPGENRVLAYSCTFASRPDDRGGTTATATWDGGEAAADAPVRFVLDRESDRTVRVYGGLAGPGGDRTPSGVAAWKPAPLGAPGWNRAPLGVAEWNRAGKPTEFGSTVAFDGTAGTCADFTGTASIVRDGGMGPRALQSMRLCAEAPPEVTTTAVAGFDRAYHWRVAHAADRTRTETAEGTPASLRHTTTATPDGFTDSEWTLDGTIAVRNPNDYKPLEVAVADIPDVGGGSCRVADGESVLVPAGGERTLEYRCRFDGRPDDAGTATAVVSWFGAAGTSVAEASADVDFELRAETDRSVTVVADRAGAGPTVLGTAAWDASGNPVRFDYAADVDGAAGECAEHTSEARLEETGQAAVATATVCVEAPLRVEATAVGALERTYLWSIDTSAVRERVMQGTWSAPASYRVAVTPRGHADSGWSLAGTVAVTNPNTYKGMAATAGLDHTLGGGGACRFDGGSGDVVLAAGETAVLAYGCTFAQRPASTGRSLASVEWRGASGGAAAEEATDVVFAPAAEAHRTVTVEDDGARPGARPLVLGSAAWNAEGAPQIFAYDLELGVEAGTCEPRINTATIVETGDSASATVTFCGVAGRLQAVQPSTALPSTGADVGALVAASLAMLAAGTVALLAGTRRRR
ncbi:hypothetical protein ACX8Z9_02340 [Arthrobacter halodurans]